MRKKTSVFKVLLAIVLIVGVVGLLTTCAQAPKEEKTGESEQAAVQLNMIDEVLRNGVIKVGCGVFTPWSFKDKNGNLVGFEIDVATRLAEDLGVKLEMAPTQWSGIIPALLTGKFDVIIGGMTITPERAKKVNFSIPYYFMGQAMVVNKKIAAGLNSMEDFNDSRVVIACRLGSTAQMAAEKLFPKATLHQFDDEAQVVQELLNGEAHAVVSGSPKPESWALKYPDILALAFEGALLTNEPNGFAVRKGDHDSLTYLNNWITVARADGFIQEREHYWFKTADWQDLVE